MESTPISICSQGVDMRVTNAHTSTGLTKSVTLNGWKRQPKDERDEAYRLKLHGAYSARPASADLRAFCSPIEDQADIGSCTANAAAALIESNEIRAGRKLSDALGAAAQVSVSNVITAADGSITFTAKVVPATVDPTPAPTPTQPLVHVSRLFEYYATRLLEGTTSYDSGAYIRDAIKAMAKYGVVTETMWPYVTSQFAANPPSAVWTEAAKHKISSYHSIADGDLESMKVAISQGSLIEFGFDVYSAFMTPDMASKGLLCRPKATETLEGGHAVVLCGYDDTKIMPDGSVGAFLVRNSWGTAWGLKGYYWMTYNYVGDTKLASDFWVVVSQPF